MNKAEKVSVRFATLEEVVEFYDQGGIMNPHLSKLIIPLGLSAQEKKDLAWRKIRLCLARSPNRPESLNYHGRNNST